MVTSERDVYALLGIAPTASSALARELYWRKVGDFLEAERGGDPAARLAIEELNQALAIVMDRTLRAEYDAQHGVGEVPLRVWPVGPLLAAGVEDRSRRRSVFVVGMLPLLLFVIWVTLRSAGPAPAAMVTGVGTVIFLLAARWATRDLVAGLSPFRVLQLREGATLEMLDAAYQMQVHELLLSLKQDPSALRRLEILDEAYRRAALTIAQGESGLPGRRERMRGVDWLGRQTRRAGRRSLRAVEQAAHWLLRTLMAAAAGLGDRGRRASSAAWATVRRPRASAREREHDDAAQIERRLSSAFRMAAERVAAAPGPPAGDRTARRTARLVLGASGGERRIAVGASPVSIGSAPSCDVILRLPGVSAEHAIAWLRDDLLLFHVTDPNAACLVNGHPMIWATLEDGDELQLGAAQLRVEFKD